MSAVNLKDAKAGFSSLVDKTIKGEFVTITRHGKPVAALVSLEAAEIARKAMERKRSGLQHGMVLEEGLRIVDPFRQQTGRD